MSRSIFFPLLFLSVLLPSPICSQLPSEDPRRHHHRHHSHLDTDPDLELSPVRPNYAMMTSRSPTMRDWIHLPTVPSFPDNGELSLDNTDYEDSYDYNTQWNGESSGAAGTESQSTVAATEDEEDDYVDPFGNEGHRDHFKNGSSAVILAWFLFFLPLVISMVALLLS